MNEANILSTRDARYKAQAENYLAEAGRILRQLSAERQRQGRRRATTTSILAQVKGILQDG